MESVMLLPEISTKLAAAEHAEESKTAEAAGAISGIPAVIRNGFGRGTDSRQRTPSAGAEDVGSVISSTEKCSCCSST